MTDLGLITAPLRPAGDGCRFVVLVLVVVSAVGSVRVVRLRWWGDHVSALIFKFALKIQPLMSEIKDSAGFNTIASLCMPLS